MSRRGSSCLAGLNASGAAGRWGHRPGPGVLHHPRDVLIALSDPTSVRRVGRALIPSMESSVWTRGLDTESDRRANRDQDRASTEAEEVAESFV